MPPHRMTSGYPPISCGYPATYPRPAPDSLRFPSGAPAAQMRHKPSLFRQKLLQKLSQGDFRNVPFADMVSLVKGFSFILKRTRGSHHIFAHPHIPELINFQEVAGEAKPCQIRQFLRLIEKYNIMLGDA